MKSIYYSDSGNTDSVNQLFGHDVLKNQIQALSRTCKTPVLCLLRVASLFDPKVGDNPTISPTVSGFHSATASYVANYFQSKPSSQPTYMTKDNHQ